MSTSRTKLDLDVAVGRAPLHHQNDSLDLPALELLETERQPGADLLLVGDYAAEGKPTLEPLGFAGDPPGLEHDIFQREAIGQRLDPEQVHVRNPRQLPVGERRHAAREMLAPLAGGIVELAHELNRSQSLVLVHAASSPSSSSGVRSTIPSSAARLESSTT